MLEVWSVVCSIDSLVLGVYPSGWILEMVYWSFALRCLWKKMIAETTKDRSCVLEVCINLDIVTLKLDTLGSRHVRETLIQNLSRDRDFLRFFLIRLNWIFLFIKNKQTFFKASLKKGPLVSPMAWSPKRIDSQTPLLKNGESTPLLHFTNIRIGSFCESRFKSKSGKWCRISSTFRCLCYCLLFNLKLFVFYSKNFLGPWVCVQVRMWNIFVVQINLVS